MTPDELEERIRDAMISEQAAPRPELWEQVRARRQRGDRVLLPVTRLKSRRTTLIAFAAAAAVLLLVPLVSHRATVVESVGKSPSHGSANESDNHFLPSALLAQSPAFTNDFGASDREFRPGRWTHGRIEHGVTVESFDYNLSRSEYAGNPAWRVISQFTPASKVTRSFDTLWATPDGMEPLFRVSHVNDYRVEQTYRKDDILSGTTRNGYTAWDVVPLHDSTRKFGGGTLMRPSEMAIRLQAMPLALGWKGSILLPTVGSQQMAALWLNLVVSGEEVIQVPAGRFECWRLVTVGPSGTTGAYDPEHPEPGLYFWISKDRQWLIQMSVVNNSKDLTPLVLLSGMETE